MAASKTTQCSCQTKGLLELNVVEGRRGEERRGEGRGGEVLSGWMIQHLSQRRHAHSKWGARAPSDFWAKWNLNAASKRQKNSRLIFSIIQSHRRAYNVQCLISSAAKFKSATDAFYSTAHYNQSHTMLLSLWMQWPIRGVQMSHR